MNQHWNNIKTKNCLVSLCTYFVIKYIIKTLYSQNKNIKLIRNVIKLTLCMTSFHKNWKNISEKGASLFRCQDKIRRSIQVISISAISCNGKYWAFCRSNTVLLQILTRVCTPYISSSRQFKGTILNDFIEKISFLVNGMKYIIKY